MKYTIGTDARITALHLITLNDCIEHGNGYLELDAIEMLTYIVSMASGEFERKAREVAADSTRRLRKEDPRYRAIRDLQTVLRQAYGQLDELI